MQCKTEHKERETGDHLSSKMKVMNGSRKGGRGADNTEEVVVPETHNAYRRKALGPRLDEVVENRQHSAAKYVEGRDLIRLLISGLDSSAQHKFCKMLQTLRMREVLFQITHGFVGHRFEVSFTSGMILHKNKTSHQGF